MIDHYYETVLYDAPNIVGAVGGSLGLFLGFSCYDFALFVLSIISGRVKKVFAKEEKEVGYSVRSTGKGRKLAF